MVNPLILVTRSPIGDVFGNPALHAEEPIVKLAISTTNALYQSREKKNKNGPAKLRENILEKKRGMDRMRNADPRASLKIEFAFGQPQYAGFDPVFELGYEYVN